MTSGVAAEPLYAGQDGPICFLPKPYRSQQLTGAVLSALGDASSPL